MESVVRSPPLSTASLVGNGGHHNRQHAMTAAERCNNKSFQMPLHYPRFTQADYETMPEWKLDSLLQEYGLPSSGDLQHKRKFAMGCFLWPN